MNNVKISVIVISYNMARELPRTIFSLTVPYQKNISIDDYEIIIIDNNSTQEIDIDNVLPENGKFYRFRTTSTSPVEAINYGLSLAKGQFIGLCIDGARILSPNILSQVVLATKLYEQPVISTMAYHLGPEVQMKSVENGYNQQVEDELLKSVIWMEDGYQLFKISSFAGSSSRGWFFPIAESNAFFLSKEMWDKLGGVDERFQAHGGGLVNLDTYKRAIEFNGGQVISLLGEGTFHQVHGGIATNQKRADASWQVFNEEYKGIRGVDYTPPTYRPLLMGEVNASHCQKILESVSNLSEK